MSATAVVIATIGGTDVHATAKAVVPQPQQFDDPYGRSKNDLRQWGAALQEAIRRHGVPAVAGELALPKLQPILQRIATNEAPDGAAIDVVLLASDQPDAGDPQLQAFRREDTVTVAAALTELLGVITDVDLREVHELSLTGNPAAFEDMWEATGPVIDRLCYLMRPVQLHLATVGGAPAMGHAIKARCWDVAARHAIEVRSWRLVDGAAQAERSVELLAGSAERHRIRELADAYGFADVLGAVAVTDALPAETAQRLRHRAQVGQKLLELDLAGLHGQPEDDGLQPVLDAAAALRFVDEPHERGGALEDLTPLYRHLLEVLAVRWQRDETTLTVAVLHLIGEFVGLLAWQRALDHPADPRRLPAWVQRPHCLWGVGGDGCAHPPAITSVARRLRDDVPARTQPTPPTANRAQWQRFLRDDYARVADALLACGHRRSAGPASKPRKGCTQPCAIVTDLDQPIRQSLEARSQVAAEFAASPLMTLRHHAPVGHFFGVPSADEVGDALRHTMDRVLRVDLGGADLGDPWQQLHTQAEEVRRDPVGQMPAAISRMLAVVAGAPLSPSTLLADTKTLVTDELTDP